MADSTGLSSDAEPEASALSVYQRLCIDNLEIRVIDLLPGQDETPIVGTLRTVSLSEETRFGALSYVWGDTVEKTPIQVNGQIFQVTLNLAAALRALRSVDMVRTLWVDAVCIDQSDPIEREEQVSLMRDIYETATRVHIWLGEFPANWRDELPSDVLREWDFSHDDLDADDRMIKTALNAIGLAIDPSLSPERDDMRLTGTVCDADLVLRHFEDMETLRPLHSLPFYRIERDDSSGLLNARCNKDWFVAMSVVVWILSRPWWTRAWTLQEAVVPEITPLVHIGKYTVPLQSLLNVAIHTIIFLATDDARTQSLLTALCFGEDILNPSFQKVAITLYGLRLSLHVTDEPVKIRELFKYSSQRRASDPRDHVYSILGFLPELSPIKADYTIGFSEVSCRATKLLMASDDLAEWSSYAFGVNTEHHPSWALKLDNEKSLFNGRYMFEGTCNDSQDQQIFIDQMFQPNLILKTAKVATVAGAARVTTTTADDADYKSDVAQAIVQEYQQVYERYGARQTPLAFWRTVLRNTKPTGIKPSDEIVGLRQKISQVEIEAAIQSFHDLISGKPRATITATDGIVKSEQVEVPPSFLDLRWNFFCCKEGEPGMGRLDVQSGDEIFIVKGCTIPIVLRKIEDSGSTEMPTYNFVGECYLDEWIGDAENEDVAAKRLGVEWHDVTLV